MAKAKIIKRPVAPAPRAASKPRKSPPADTREGLIAEMQKLLEGAEVVIRSQRSVYWGSYSGSVGVFRERVSKLTTRMAALLGPKSEERPMPIFAEACGLPAGQIPEGYARPCCFVQWVGFVPVLVTWGGMLQTISGTEWHAVDPNEVWLTTSGYRSGYMNSFDGTQPFLSAVRRALVDFTLARDFKLVRLEGYAQNTARLQLHDAPWLQDALKAGPQDPIPLPPKFSAVQRSLI